MRLDDRDIDLGLFRVRKRRTTLHLNTGAGNAPSKWEVCISTGGAHSRQLPDAFQQLRIELGDFRIILILGAWQLHSCSQYAFGLESGIDSHQTSEAANQQSRTGKNDHRQSDFCHHKAVPGSPAMNTLGATAAALLQFVIRPSTSSLNRGHDSEKKTSHHSDSARKGKHAEVNLYAIERNQAFGCERQQRTRTPARQQ